ncbi:MAG: hypothetical protein AB7K04_00560 [Pseudorhodoplanes sp.]
MALDLLVVGRGAHLMPNDSITGMYGLGLNWLTLDPWPTSHHPDFLFQQLSAPLILLGGIARRDLSGFLWAGIALQAAFVLLAAWWMAALAQREGLRPLQVLCFGFACATMPDLLVSATTWGHYFPIGVLLPPLGLALFAIFDRDENERSQVVLAMFGLGFVVSNYFVMLALCIPVGLLALHRGWRSDSAAVARWLGVTAAGRKWWISAAAIFAAANTIFPFYKAVWRAPTYQLDWQIMSYALALSLVPAALATILLFWFDRAGGKWDRLLQGLLSPALWGWLAGANVMSIFWMTAAVTTFLHKRGSLADMQASQQTFSALVNPGWNLLVIAIVGVALLLAFTARTRTRWFLVLFCAGGTAISIAIAWRLLLSHTPDSGFFGLAARFFLPALAALAPLYLLLQRRGIATAWVTNVALVAIACVTLVQAAQALIPATARARAADRELTQAVSKFLTEHPDGTVICVNAEAPEACGFLYAWNRYRKPESLPKLSSPPVLDGRAVYAERTCADEDYRRCIPSATRGPVALVIASGIPGNPPGRTLARVERFGETVIVFAPAATNP